MRSKTLRKKSGIVIVFVVFSCSVAPKTKWNQEREKEKCMGRGGWKFLCSFNWSVSTCLRFCFVDCRFFLARVGYCCFFSRGACSAAVIVIVIVLFPGHFCSKDKSAGFSLSLFSFSERQERKWKRHRFLLPDGEWACFFVSD